MSKSFRSCYWSVWKKTFVYSGCTTRYEFWSFIIINIFIFLLIAAGSYYLLVNSVADGITARVMAWKWVYYIYIPLRTFVPLILLFPVLSAGVRRMHDIGRSGGWFVGLVITELFVLPAISLLMYHMLTHFLPETESQRIVEGISISMSLIVAVILAGLCCKATKIQDPALSSDVMN